MFDYLVAVGTVPSSMDRTRARCDREEFFFSGVVEVVGSMSALGGTGHAALDPKRTYRASNARLQVVRCITRHSMKR